ncbi:hypothetical protein JCM5353_005311 [Sporobolomyces roseus]
MAPTLRVRRAAAFDKPQWSEIVQVKDKEREGPLFLDLPSKVLDQILSDVDLNLRDHLALAATNRSLRSCYSSAPAVWSSLIALRPLPSYIDDVDEDSRGDVFSNIQRRKDIEYRQPENVAHRAVLAKIWSGKDVATLKEKVRPVLADKSNHGECVKVGMKRDLEEMDKDSVSVVRSPQWEEAIKLVHEKTIGKSDAIKKYRLDRELSDYLQATLVGQPRKNGGSQPAFFVELAVQALAYRLHGGVLGHKALVEKKKNAAKKMRETKRKNGTAGVWVFTGGR